MHHVHGAQSKILPPTLHIGAFRKKGSQSHTHNNEGTDESAYILSILFLYRIRLTKNKAYKKQHAYVGCCKRLEKLHVLEFQEMMRRIYFHRDSERGTTGTYNWLVEEVEELGAALKEQDHKAVMNEFADVLAWLASLANVVEIDLESAAISKYNYTCPKCSKSLCECPFSKTH